jgi:hypothetical protein
LGTIRTLTTLRVTIMRRLRIGWRGPQSVSQHALQAGLDLVVGQVFID